MRRATIQRQTHETFISLTLDLDGTGQCAVQTGLGFLDHMLAHIAVHGLFDLTVQAQGDLHVDPHHTVEDVALALGAAFDQALGDKTGIARVGSVYVPMDEALVLVVIDFSGRPYAVVEGGWTGSVIGGIPVTLIPHFIESFAATARATVHARLLYGRDDHHKAEALFKALGRALDLATRIDPRRGRTIPSTKGTL